MAALPNDPRASEEGAGLGGRRARIKKLAVVATAARSELKEHSSWRSDTEL